MTLECSRWPFPNYWSAQKLHPFSPQGPNGALAATCGNTHLSGVLKTSPCAGVVGFSPCTHASVGLLCPWVVQRCSFSAKVVDIMPAPLTLSCSSYHNFVAVWTWPELWWRAQIPGLNLFLQVFKAGNTSQSFFSWRGLFNEMNALAKTKHLWLPMWGSNFCVVGATMPGSTYIFWHGLWKKTPVKVGFIDERSLPATGTGFCWCFYYWFLDKSPNRFHHCWGHAPGEQSPWVHLEPSRMFRPEPTRSWSPSTVTPDLLNYRSTIGDKALWWPILSDISKDHPKAHVCPRMIIRRLNRRDWCHLSGRAMTVAITVALQIHEAVSSTRESRAL